MQSYETQLFDLQRHRMVKEQIEKRGIRDRNVLNAMARVPRHLFVPNEFQLHAYEDCPLNIGYNQTISQPYIVAFLVQAAHLNSDSIVLDVGTGCGYQAAVLAEICKTVYTIEIIELLGKKAAELLHALYSNIQTKIGDGYEGWSEHAPFDAILIAAASKKIPPKLVAQLKLGGNLIMPLEEGGKQTLMRYTKTDTSNNFTAEELATVRFVPMRGKVEEKEKPHERREEPSW